MDLLRLALERAKNAEGAVDVIVSLLEAYGQNANANPFFDRRYENSFMICDPKEIWLLETAGRRYAARRIPDYAAISNCYTIGRQYDRSSADLEQYARARRWTGPDEPFDFARAYTLGALRQRMAVPRWRALAAGMERLMREGGGRLSEQGLRRLFRSHFEGELLSPRFGATSGTFTSICMHAQTITEAKTASSLFVTYDREEKPVVRCAPGSPCCSVYLPVCFGEDLPDALRLGGPVFEEASLWWQMERLCSDVSVDEARFGGMARRALAAIQEDLDRRVSALAPEDRTAQRQLMEEAAGALLKQAAELSGRIEENIRRSGGIYGRAIELLEEYAARARLPLSGI